MSTLIAGTYTGAATKVASAVLAGYSTPVANGADIRSSLFTNGEKGVWFDPSDFSTLFQDSAGTTPVTAVGQPVGEILDKSGNGFHATQATTTKRPILARHPITGRRNLLTYTEDFSNGIWGKTSLTATYGASNVATLTAVAGTVSPALSGAPVTVTAATYTASIKVKAGTHRYIQLSAQQSTTQFVNFDLVAGVFGTPTGVTAASTFDGEFYRLSITYAAAATASGLNTYMVDSLAAGRGAAFAAAGTETVYAKEAQIELSATPTAYQKVVSTYDVTEAGINSVYFLRFDGVDDFLVTPSIDFSATDKMSVFAGVRKLSDAAIAIIVESSVSIATNNGAFALYCPAGVGTNDYAATSKGTIQVNKDTAANYPSPNTAVCAATFDIIGDSVWLRVNSSETVSSIADQGLGNYGNYPLYIGMRAGTALPLNGQLYSLIVRGALSDANQIAASEAYVNSKTGAY